jgi:hypothetical protein
MAGGRWIRAGRICTFWIRAGVCLLLVFRSFAADISEYQVKALFLLNFAKFVDWPPASFASSDSPIAICVFGKDPFGRGIDQLVQGETVNGRRLAVRRITQAPAPQTCQIFFTQEPAKEIAEILGSLGPGVRLKLSSRLLAVARSVQK